MDKLKALVVLISQFCLSVIAYIAKNAALVVGVVEALAKLIAGIINIFASAKQKDKLIAIVDMISSYIKKILYTISDKLSGLSVPK